MDEQFGRIVQRVKDLGLWDNTYSLFFTDHGEFRGDSGLIEKWPSGVSDSLTHEPLIIGMFESRFALVLALTPLNLQLDPTSLRETSTLLSARWLI